MTTKSILPMASVTQYDGTNSTEILSLFPQQSDMSSVLHDPEIISEDEGVLVIGWPNTNDLNADVVINESDWVFHKSIQNYDMSYTATDDAVDTLWVNAASLVNPS